MFNWMNETFHGKIFRRVAGFRSDFGNHPLPQRRDSERPVQAKNMTTNENLKRSKTTTHPRRVSLESEQVAVGEEKESLAAKQYFDSLDNRNAFSRQASPAPEEVGHRNDSSFCDPDLEETLSNIDDQSLSGDAACNGVTYRSIHGLGNTVLALTETSITNWNTIIQCQRVVDEATQELDDVEAKMGEMEVLMRRRPEDRGTIPKKWEALYRQRKSVLDIMKRAERDMAAPRTQIYDQLKRLLENEKLIGTAKTDEDYRNECHDDEEGDQSVEEDDGQYQQENMSPDEVGRAVAEAVRRAESALKDAKTRTHGLRETRESHHEDQFLSISVAESTESGEDCEHTIFDDGPEEMEDLRTPFVYEEAHEHELDIGYDSFPLHQDPQVEEMIKKCREHLRREQQLRYTESVADRENAETHLHSARRAYENARALVDNWDAIADDNLDAYLQEVEDETNSISQTEFDCTMLGMSRTAIRNLIKAEERYDEVRAHAREVGLLQHHVDQESEFPDYPDDGYRESFEAGMVEHLDCDVLYKWLDGLDAEADGESVNHDADSHWDVKTVDVQDTFSNYAEGRYRKGIDAWELKCAEMKASLPAELLHFRNLEDDRIKAALEMPGRLRSYSCSF